MNLETLILLTKGWCLTSGAMAAGLAGGLPQIGAASVFGADTKLVCLLCGVYAVGCNTLYGYLSQGTSNYMKTRTNGNGAAAVPEPKPVTPTTIP